MTETRWRDIAMALINRVHDQQVTVTIEELEKAKATNNAAIIDKGAGRFTIKASGWPDESRIDVIGQNGNNGDHYK